ncbi:MAG: uroporphyrinogen decarboxylase [Calditrichaeota bacterium]|nr:uroporphyrinogen decarboxylase [Calditrichota bacterium]
MKQQPDHLFIRACLNQPVERTPVWMMRQAGRYLPEYRAVRANYDFITMYKTPELAAEVTLQPVDIIGVDAAILFSDILVIPEAMGMKLIFSEGKGPQFPEPLRDERQVAGLRRIDAEADLSFVMDSIRLVRRELDGRVPLIGFSGAPWTLATYMVEGGGSKNFKMAKQWRFARPELLHQLLRQITAAVIDYCRAKIDAGAQAIQLFDSWAGILDEAGFREFALPYVQEIIQAIRRPGVPVIYFAKGGMTWLSQLQESGADVLGLDWTINPQTARRLAGDQVTLQGNLDPTALYAPPEKIRKMVREMLRQFGPQGHVANLGHGILPDIPVENARAFVAAVKEESAVMNKSLSTSS